MNGATPYGVVGRWLVLAFAAGWLGGYLHGVAVGERDRVDRDP